MNGNLNLDLPYVDPSNANVHPHQIGEYLDRMPRHMIRELYWRILLRIKKMTEGGTWAI